MTKFKVGDRVKITVDADPFPRGTGGMIDYTSPNALLSIGCGVQLDGDPTGLSAWFDWNELELES
jgi:hypothetical protein